MTLKQNRQQVLDVHPTAVARFNHYKNRYEVRYEPHGQIISQAYTLSMAWSKAAEKLETKHEFAAQDSMSEFCGDCGYTAKHRIHKVGKSC